MQRKEIVRSSVYTVALGFGLGTLGGNDCVILYITVVLPFHSVKRDRFTPFRSSWRILYF